MEHRRYFDVSVKVYESIFKSAWKSKAAAQFIINDLQHSMKRDGIPHTSSTRLSLLKCCEVTNNIMELVRICELELRTDHTTGLFNDYSHEAKQIVEKLAERCDRDTKDIILKFFDD